MKAVLAALTLALVCLPGSLAFAQAEPGAASAKTSFKFDFGPGAVAPGFTQVRASDLYSPERGFGFEPGGGVQEVDRGGANALTGDYATSAGIFLFSVAVPEGNYKVSVTLGDASEPTTTTVKAETRQLMLERIHTEPGQFATRSFTVNVRGPEILEDKTPAAAPARGGAPRGGGRGGNGGGRVMLDPREWDAATGKILMLHWDNKLTLEFCDSKPAVCAVEIEKIDDATTIFLVSDSTVTEQVREPYGTWGMYLPRWFKPEVAIANYAESGETLRAFRFERRWAKVMSEVRPGDYVFMQFGHNDRNARGQNAMWPISEPSGDWANTFADADTDYKRLLKNYAAEAKAKGAIPVIVSSMTNINRQTGELNPAGLMGPGGVGNYPKAAMEAAKEADVAAIDLNEMSREVMTGLGPEQAVKVTVDGLHTNSIGGYLLSRCIVEGIKKDFPDLAKHLVDDAGNFDPAHPQPLPDAFKIPLEPAPRFGGFGGRGLRGGRGGLRGGAPATTGGNPGARGN